MINCYYAIRMYVEEYPKTINCQDLMDMADRISDLFGCQYDHLGYCLLHPDYDYKDLGTMLKNTVKNRERFTRLSIPLKFYGKKEERPDSPFVEFELKPEDPMKLPFYSIVLEYPSNDSEYLCVKIDIKENLISKELTISEFVKLQDLVCEKGYIINSAYVHYHSGNCGQEILEGGDRGMIMTINDNRILDHSLDFMVEWKDRIMDVFYINSFNRALISETAMGKIRKIVGGQNIVESGEKIIFKLPHSRYVYLLNRMLSTRSRSIIKKILQNENVCKKDQSIIAAILRL